VVRGLAIGGSWVLTLIRISVIDLLTFPSSCIPLVLPAGKVGNGLSQATVLGDVIFSSYPNFVCHAIENASGHGRVSALRNLYGPHGVLRPSGLCIHVLRARSTAHGDATCCAILCWDNDLAAVELRIADRGKHLSAHSQSRHGSHHASHSGHRCAVACFPDVGLGREVDQAGTACSMVGALGCLVCRGFVGPIASAGVAALAVVRRHRDKPQYRTGPGDFDNPCFYHSADPLGNHPCDKL